MPGFDPNALGTPNRGTSEYQLDQWNRAMRSSPIYRNFMIRHRLPADGRVRLSRDQQSALERDLRAAGFNIPGGMHIDQGGNLNQKNRLVRNSLIGAAVGGGGLAGLGLAGIGPLGGLGGGGAAASAGASGSLPPIAGGAPWAVTPYATTATMAGTGAGGGAAGAVGAGLGGGAVGADAVGRTIAGLSPRDLAALGMAGASTINGVMSGGNISNQPTTATTDPNLQKLIATMQGRIDKSEPLHDAILAMANGLLPVQYQKGGGGMA